MQDNLSFRSLESGKEIAACNLVRRVFGEYVSSYYTSDGIDEFYKITDPELLIGENSKDDKTILVAVCGIEIIGIIKMKGGNHVSWLFIEGEHQKKGVGKELLRHAINICIEKNPSLSHITVNASPNSLLAYEKFGFVALGPEVQYNGMRFTPMKLDLSESEQLH